MRIAAFLVALLWACCAIAQPVPPAGSVLQLNVTPVLGGSVGNSLAIGAGNKLVAGSGGSGSVTTVSVVSANGLAGSVTNPTTTPAITLSTSITGLLKGNGTAISAASAGTDYYVPNTVLSALETSITSASATALTVGRLGATTPAFQVDASAATQVAGVKITGAVTGGTVAVAAIDSGSNTNLTFNAKGSGTIGIGSVSTGVVTITPNTTVTGTLGSAAHTVTSASASSLAVGRLGASNPAFTVDSSTGTQVAGFKITGAATGGTVALVATDSGSNTNLTFNAKGSGNMSIGTVSTGALSLGTAAATSPSVLIGNGSGGGVVRIQTAASQGVDIRVGASSNALSVSVGGTNPAFLVDTSTASQVAGLSVTGAATGGTVAVAAIDSGSNTNVTFNGKGSGTVKLGNTSTGTVTIAATATPTTIPSTTITIAGVTTGTNADTLCLSAGGVILIQAAACTISSARFKTNIRPLRVSGLRIIEGLHPVSFRMREGERANPDPNFGRPQIGLTAENVAEVDGRLALYEDDLVTPKSYRQESLIAVLVKAVQELKADNDNIRAEMKRASEARK